MLIIFIFIIYTYVEVYNVFTLPNITSVVVLGALDTFRNSQMRKSLKLFLLPVSSGPGGFCGSCITLAIQVVSLAPVVLSPSGIKNSVC
ncbi:hypothetical protein GGS20DRAFT_573602 [Poronia punctata]|nr:hypothetical protein GGS20DRAFT_573602 [Poronia punctata]